MASQRGGDKPEDISTTLIHHGYRAPDGWDAVPVGVYKGSTVFFRDCADLNAPHPRDGKSYRYGLHGTPTSYTLAARLATLEGAEHCLLTPSGLAAITLVNLALLSPGDEVLLPDNVYGQNRYCADDLLPRFGITRRYYDPLDAASLTIGPNTRLVWVEAAGSITLEFPDMRALVERCRDAGVVCALDNTWGAGIAFQPFELGEGLGFGVSMQALTKYPSGGADVLAGAVYTRDEKLHDKLNTCHEHLGYHLAGNDVELVLRGLPSLALRYRAQDATTRGLACWLQGRPELAQVLHPALPGSPGHAFWRAQSGAGAACLVSAVFKPDYSMAQVHRFVDALERFRIGYSWAGPMSLVVPYDLRRSRNLPRRFAEGIVVRFAIGLEDEADLRADLERAFEVLAG
ncbi:MAG: PLP-dependent transferase [Pelomonas sp.]|nr:PLP-dependent transferase [Roseateles sp.]